MAQIWSSSVLVNTTDSGPDGNDQSQPSVAQLGDGYVVVWYDPSPDDRDYIRAQKFGFLGQKIGEEFIVSDLSNVTSSSPDVTALANGGFAVAYRAGTGGIDLSIFNADGQRLVDVPILTGTNAGADPFVVARPDGGMYVTWEMTLNGDRVVRGVEVSAAGLRGPTQTIFTGDDTVGNLDAAAFGDGGVFSLYYRDDLDSGVPGISGDRFLGFRIITEDGSFGASRRIAEATELHHIDLNSAHVARVPGYGMAVAWTQFSFGIGETVRVKVYDGSGNEIVSDEIVQPGQNWIVEDVIGYQQMNENGPGFTVIFRNEATNELRGQSYDEIGGRIGGPYHIANNVQDAQLALMADGRISVAFTRTADGNQDVRAFILDLRPGIVTGTSGDDSLTARPISTIVTGWGGDDLLYGGKAADGLDGGDGDDIMLGNGGNDALTGGRGEDTMSGGAGVDAAVFSGLDIEEGKPSFGYRTEFFVSLKDGEAILRHVNLISNAGDIEIVDTLIGIENVVGSAHDERIEGNDGNNRIRGNEGDKTYLGLGGNDTLISGTGDDDLRGGSGNDTLQAGDGSDILDGGSGADTMIGGNGYDTYITDNVSDRIIEEGDGHDVIFATNYLTFDMALTPNVENLYYNYAAGSSILATGNALNNSIVQASYGRSIDGKPAGNDILDGGAGVDVLAAGKGNDIYRVDLAADKIDEETVEGGGIDTVESTALVYNLFEATIGKIENLFFTGIGAFLGVGNGWANEIRGGTEGDALRGEAGNDTLVGLGGDDDLFGDVGNDKLSGGTGMDSLWGYLGNDSFVFTGLNEGADTIGDFSSTGTGNNDRLTFELADIGQLLGNQADGTGVLKAIHFQSSSAADATSANARFIYDTDTGSLRWDSDGTGSAASFLIAIFTGAPTLDRSDIIIV